ncbi:MAG: hypothetical protein WCD47_08480 [Candidatus Sulfotelmatobacter sp.]
MKILSTVLLVALAAFTVACGYSSKAASPPVAGTTPTIAALVPNSVNSGGAAFVLTVNGSNFSSTATINFNGTAQATNHVSANQLTATIAASNITTPATVPITVTNPGIAGTGIYNTGATLAETSAAMNFTVN